MVPWILVRAAGWPVAVVRLARLARSLDGLPEPGETNEEERPAAEQPAADREERREQVTAPSGEGDGQAGDYIDQNLETSRSAIEDRLGTDLDNVFPDDAPPAPPSSAE